MLTRGLDAGNRYVHEAVGAVAHGAAPPDPPADPGWTIRAAQQGVLPLLVAHLHGRAPVLAAAHHTGVAHHLRTLADLRVVAAALAEEGLDWLVFKGPVLSEIVYQRAGARAYGDLDVLVRPVDVDTVLRLLTTRGARPLSPGWATKQGDGLGEMVLSLPHGTFLDLHWHVVNRPGARAGFTIDTGALLAAARVVDLGGLRVPTLNAVDTLLHVALHACKSGGDRLRWVLDVHQAALRVQEPQGAVLARARELGLELALRVMVGRVRRFLHAEPLPLPPPGPGHAAWLALDALGTRLRPPGSRWQGRFSAAVLAHSVRARPGASLVALIAASGRSLRRRSVAAADGDAAVASPGPVEPVAP